MIDWYWLQGEMLKRAKERVMTDPEAHDKSCFCETCKKWFHSLGIAAHRAMHRRRHEYCEICYSDGATYSHDYRVAAHDKGGE